MEEIWKPVVGFEDLYEVSNLGRIKGTRGLLKPQARRHGYLAVWLYGHGGICGRTGKQYSIHRIVAEAFVPNPNGYEEVNHINEDKTDNRACNLEWCTHKENSMHGTRGKRIGEANLNGKRSKPVYQYLPSGELVAAYPSMAEMQRTTGYCKGNIWKQMNGIYETAYGYKWAHE